VLQVGPTWGEQCPSFGVRVMEAGGVHVRGAESWNSGRHWRKLSLILSIRM
jgi:hypothetical protein